MTTRGVSSRLVPFGSLGLMAVALVMMGTALDAHAYGDKGVIRLQVGGGGGQFVYQEDLEGPVLESQRFYAEGKGSCLLGWTAGDPRLAELTPGGGALAERPGFGATSIGVWDGPKGTPCSRVSQYANESLTFELGDYTTDLAPAGLGANAFDRLELDIEVKADAKVQLTMMVAGFVMQTYELRTGASIVPGVGLERAPGGAWPVATPTARIVNCRARSDSGPDSGPNDNCRWIIEDLGQQFVLTPLAGEFSLEGGGDWGYDYDANNSLIYLTTVVEGDLDCDSPTPEIEIGDGANDAVCQVFSQPDPTTGNCPSIHYVFRDLTGPTKGCEFIKGPGQQLAASMDITFPPEPRTDLYGMPPTFFEFPGASGYFTTDICNGELVTDDTTGLTSIKIDTLRKADGTLVTLANDAVPDNLVIDWACIQEHHVDYLGGDDPGTEEMQVIQKLFFWGDPKGIRF